MNIDRGLQWYSRLLNLALKNVEEEEGPGNFFLYIIIMICFHAFIHTFIHTEITLDSNLVKSKNCVGTVVSLNGHRRYFCIYHARYPESLSDSGGKVVVQQTVMT